MSALISKTVPQTKWWGENLCKRSNHVKHIQQITTMLAVGYVAILNKARKSHIQFDQMIIDPPKDGFTNSIIQNAVYKNFWREFSVDLSDNHTGIGLCPFQIIEEQITLDDGDKIKIKYPKPLTLGSYELLLTENDNNETCYSVFRTNTSLFEQDTMSDIYIVHSIHRKGPNLNNSFIDSDCGILVHEWMQMCHLEKLRQNALETMVKPMMYIQYNTGSSNAMQNVIDNLRADAVQTVVEGRNGTNDSSTQNAIQFDYETNTATLPIGQIVAPTQPIIPTATLFEEINKREVQFKNHADLSFNMTVQNIMADTGGLHSRSESAVAESKATMSAGNTEHIGDIISSLQAVFNLIYPDQHEPVHVVIPTRSLADNKTIYELYDRGFINSSVAAEEAGKNASIHISRMAVADKLKTKKSKKRQEGGGEGSGDDTQSKKRHKIKKEEEEEDDDNKV